MPKRRDFLRLSGMDALIFVVWMVAFPFLVNLPFYFAGRFFGWYDGTDLHGQ